jgi:hypothetical protein
VAETSVAARSGTSGGHRDRAPIADAAGVGDRGEAERNDSCRCDVCDATLAAVQSCGFTPSWWWSLT